MRWLTALAGGLWIAVIAWDTFEAVVLPRRVTRRFRTTRMFFRTTWWAWSAVARRMRPSGRRETYLSFSYPVLSFYRSQHDNQSWLAALTTVLDASALATVGVEGACQRQAQLTFAIARHTVADVAQVLGRPPLADTDRLSPDDLARLRASLGAAGVTLHAGAGADEKLAELRHMYEPYVAALSQHLLMPLPAWRAGAVSRENWRTTAWGDPGRSPRDDADPDEDD